MSVFKWLRALRLGCHANSKSIFLTHKEGDAESDSANEPLELVSSSSWLAVSHFSINRKRMRTGCWKRKTHDFEMASSPLICSSSQTPKLTNIMHETENGRMNRDSIIPRNPENRQQLRQIKKMASSRICDPLFLVLSHFT